MRPRKHSNFAMCLSLYMYNALSCLYIRIYLYSPTMSYVQCTVHEHFYGCGIGCPARKGAHFNYIITRRAQSGTSSTFIAIASQSSHNSAGDVLSVMESGSNCSSSPYAIVSRLTVPPVHIATPYGIATGSIEFLLDKDAISAEALSLALTQAFSSYFDMDIARTKNPNGLSSVSFSEILLREQPLLPDVWEVSYELLDGFDKVRAMKSLMATWNLPMAPSNTSFQYFLQGNVALLATNISLADDLAISNFTDMTIAPLTAKEAESYFAMKQGNGSAARSLGMLRGSWRRLSAEEACREFWGKGFVLNRAITLMLKLKHSIHLKTLFCFCHYTLLQNEKCIYVYTYTCVIFPRTHTSTYIYNITISIYFFSETKSGRTPYTCPHVPQHRSRADEDVVSCVMLLMLSLFPHLSPCPPCLPRPNCGPQSQTLIVAAGS